MRPSILATPGGRSWTPSGRVIGVSTAVAGDGTEGIGFAIPINIARPIMDQAVVGEASSRAPGSGSSTSRSRPRSSSRLDLPVDYGVLVRRAAGLAPSPAVVAGSPAALAGIQEGDLITAINDERIDATHPLDDLLAQYGPEERLEPLDAARRSDR